MTDNTPLTHADTDTIRRDRPQVSCKNKRDLQQAPPALQRYLRHYGFQSLLSSQSAIEYELAFHLWSGYHIARHSWRRADARGTAVVAHGLFDHSGLYLHLVKQLLDNGYSVVIFDLPGHGLSSGSPAAIASFSEYAGVFNDCLKWTQEAYSGPYFAIGQSTGCAAIMDLLIEDNPSAGSLDGVVLLAPLVRAYSWSKVVFFHTLLGRFMSKVPRHFGTNSHDKRFLHFLRHQDPLQAPHISVLWVSAMVAWAKKLEYAPASQLNIPILVIQGSKDNTVDWRWNLPVIQRRFSRVRVHMVKGGLHHLVNEGNTWRREVFDALCRFLRAPDA